MKLSKVKKVCCNARQMALINTDGGTNMVTQWVGTDAAMYPLQEIRVSQGQLEKLWELGENVLFDMKQAPVTVEACDLEEPAGQIDISTAPRVRMCNLDGYEVLRPEGGGLMYIPEWLLKPLEGTLDFVPLPSGWVAVYEGGVLGAMVRPVEDKWRGQLDVMVRAMAEALK